MKYFVKSFAVFIAWTYLLTCLTPYSPYSPCYAMDNDEQTTSAFLTKKSSSQSSSSLQEEPLPQPTSWFAKMKKVTTTVFWDVPVLFVATLFSSKKTTKEAQEFYQQKGKEVLKATQDQITEIRTDGLLTYTANKTKKLVKAIAKNPLDTVTVGGGVLLAWTRGGEVMPLLGPCLKGVSNLKLSKGLANLASSMTVRTRSGKLAKFALYSTAIFCIAAIPGGEALEWSSYKDARAHYNPNRICSEDPWPTVITPAYTCLHNGKSLEECRTLIPTGQTVGDDIYIFARHPTSDARFDPVSIVKLQDGQTCFYTSLTADSPVTKTCFPNMKVLATRTVETVPELTLSEAHEGLKSGQGMRHIGLHLKGNKGSCGGFHEMTTDYDNLGEEPICLLTALKSGGEVTQMCFNPKQPESLTLKSSDASLTFDESDGRPFSLIIKDPKSQGLNVLPDVKPENSEKSSDITKEQGFLEPEKTKTCTNPPLKDLSLQEVIELWKKEKASKDEL